VNGRGWVTRHFAKRILCDPISYSQASLDWCLQYQEARHSTVVPRYVPVCSTEYGVVKLYWPTTYRSLPAAVGRSTPERR
jgi:hypothetical protein